MVSLWCELLCKLSIYTLKSDQWITIWRAKFSGVATGERGQSATADSEKIAQKWETGKKSGKIGKKRPKSGGFFHFATPDRWGWLCYWQNLSWNICCLLLFEIQSHLQKLRSLNAGTSELAPKKHCLTFLTLHSPFFLFLIKII